MSELENSLMASRRRFHEVNDRIRALLASDVTSFVTRVVRATFVEQADVASALNEADLIALKKATQRLAEVESERVRAALEPREIWEHTVAAPEDGWSLDGVPVVWDPLEEVSDAVAKLVTSHGFKATERLRYKAPKYFVDGDYLPTLGEHHWRLLSEIRGLAVSVHQAEREAHADELAARWDDAGSS